jgi:hypothetical protein
MRRPLVLAAILAAAVAVHPAHAQARDNTIDPGMTKAQVIEHLGTPASVKTADTLTYMFYANGCEKTCGMQDLVVLSRDKVIDAIFRDPRRKYTGESSSPNMVTAAEARKEGAARKSGAAPTAAPKADSTPPTGGAMVLPTIKPPPAPVAPPAAKSDTAPKKSDTAAAKPPAA